MSKTTCPFGGKPHGYVWHGMMDCKARPIPIHAGWRAFLAGGGGRRQLIRCRQQKPQGGHVRSRAGWSFFILALPPTAGRNKERPIPCRGRMLQLRYRYPREQGTSCLFPCCKDIVLGWGCANTVSGLVNLLHIVEGRNYIPSISCSTFGPACTSLLP